jgi:hypothetical protein
MTEEFARHAEQLGMSRRWQTCLPVHTGLQNLLTATPAENPTTRSRLLLTRRDFPVATTLSIVRNQRSFDDLIGAQQKGLGYCEAERLGGLEIYD